MKDLELVAHVYNNQLKERRERLGLTQKQMAEKVGLGLQTYGHLETLRGRPKVGGKGAWFKVKAAGWGKVRAGDWHPAVVLLAKFHGVTPEELFPPITHEPLRRNVVKRKINEIELRPMIEAARKTVSLESHEDAMDRSVLQEAVGQALGTLTRKERAVLNYRFGLSGKSEETLEEVGERWGVSRERIRQIERKALHRLRHPKRRKLIEALWRECES